MAEPTATTTVAPQAPTTTAGFSGTVTPRIRTIGIERSPQKDMYHYVLKLSWPAFFGLVAIVFLFANLVFASAYLARPGSIANARPGSFEDAFYFSVQTIATIGYGGMHPATRYAHLLVVVEALTGILGIAVITGLTFTRFSRPSARVLFSNRVTLTPRDGVPHLMFRMANWRRNRIVEARLRIIMLIDERTREGEMLRRQVDIPLVRAETAIFFLTWTAMHRVDEASPFYGPGAMEALRTRRAELFLSLTGFDETIGQTIHARREYALGDIVVGVRFADVLTLNADGSRQIDYRKFHDVVPLAPRAGDERPTRT
jgi:inward rectifier potassium channel